MANAKSAGTAAMKACKSGIREVTSQFPSNLPFEDALSAPGMKPILMANCRKAGAR
jgi:hypothetical protein